MEKTSNTASWKEALKNINGGSAFSLINNPKRDLTQKQKDTLWKLWGELKTEKYTTEWFAKEELPTKAIQERLMNLPSHVSRL